MKTLLICLMSLGLFFSCSTVKSVSESEEGKKAIDTAKEKLQEKETQEKIKSMILKDEKKK